MAGQVDWKDHGSGVNDYVVMPEIVKGLSYEAQMKTVFVGKLNGPREVKTTEIIHGGGRVTIDAGNDSPVWQKPMDENNMARFTMREENKGMATYGDAEVKPGDFAQYKHAQCSVIQVDSPAYPVVGFESAQNIKRVVNELVSVEKSNIALWRSKEIDFDAFRALYMGASRGLLLTTDGGKGVALNGAAQGQGRSCFNTYVASQPGLTTPSTNAATHEQTLANLLGGLNNSQQFAFTYDTHLMISYLVDSLRLQEVRIGGQTYRAIALIDEWNVYRLREAGATLPSLWANATERAATNKALYSRGALELDDIFYLPVHQMKYFRPRAENNAVVYGAGLNVDPRSKSFTNHSNITTTIIMGRGALLRGKRKDGGWFTVKEGDHGKGASYCYHDHDGWMRNEWYTRDGRDEMSNDSSLVVFNYDEGPLTSRS